MDEHFQILTIRGPSAEDMAAVNITDTGDRSTCRDRELGPSIFEEPVCMIESGPDGKLVANEKAVCQLEKIEKTVNCVAIAGLYRTGKSYLLNRLAGKSSGFALGSTIQSKTKGIWVWCIPHPHHPDQVLVLLDTEGLGDANKGDQNHDNWIFALAVLLSSTLVYNALGAIDQGAIEKLNFVTEISKHIKTKENAGESKDFDNYFPNFVFCLRDFNLELEIDGRKVTSDEYLEHTLEYKKGSDEKSAKYNEPRQCIRRYFTKRKCFTFDRPGNKKTLLKLEQLTDSDLEEEFVADVQEFCRYIHRECPPMKLDIGTHVSGRMFATIVTSYIDAIRTGAVPCIENTLNTMAQLENTKAVDEGVKLYDEFMVKNLSLPTDSDDRLSQLHHKGLEESVAFFMKKAIYDKDRKYQHKMNKEIMENFNEWKNRNEQASVDKCRSVLEDLNTAIADKLESGVYMYSGGYAMYQQDVHSLHEEYDSTGGLGVKAKDTLLAFLNEKWTEGLAILKADEKLSAEEKKLEEQRQKAHDAERQKRAAEREAELIEKHAKDMEKMMKENFEQIEKKRKEDLENMKIHNEEVLKSRLIEQQKTLNEGFSEQARELQSQIDLTKREQDELQRNMISKDQEIQARIQREKELREENRIEQNRITQYMARSNEDDSEDDSEGGCFADTSLVKVQHGDDSVVKMTLNELKVGDRVESYDFLTNKVVFSEVYFIAHSTESDTYGYDLLHLKFDRCDGIRLDRNHLIYVSNGNELDVSLPTQPIRASEVNTGDRVWIREGEVLSPKKVSDIVDIKSGIRHPMTMNHVIIVDDVLASVHMYHERAYRALTSPLRLLYAVSPSLVQSRFVTKVVSAWDYVEKLM